MFQKAEKAPLKHAVEQQIGAKTQWDEKNKPTAPRFARNDPFIERGREQQHALRARERREKAEYAGGEIAPLANGGEGEQCEQQKKALGEHAHGEHAKRV